MSERVTLELSDELARRARTVAVQTDRSLEEVLVAGIDRGLTGPATSPTCGAPEQPAVTPVWLRRSLEKLHGLSKLRPDWDSHGGLPLQPEVRRFAERLLGWVTEELPLPAVVLGSGGTVQFEWQVDGRELRIEVLAPGRLGWLKVHPDGNLEEGQLASPIPDQVNRLTRWVAHG